MNIDKNAPLSASQEIYISAPITNIWSALTEIDQWAAWQPDATNIKLEGDRATGAIFRWKANGLHIISTIQELETLQQIGWTGNSLGMNAIHVKTQESLSGWFLRILKLFGAARHPASRSGFDRHAGSW